jgi:homeobox protein ESX1
LPVVPAPYDVVPVVDDPVAPVPVVPVAGEPLVVPVAVPVERVVLPLLIEPLVVPVEPVVPAFGPELWVLLLGEPEAPPWPPAPAEPVCARAPPHAIAAAAERARILRVCLMGYS